MLISLFLMCFAQTTEISSSLKVVCGVEQLVYWNLQ